MSKIFLLSANVTTDPYAVYPLGMAVISAALNARGHQVRQYDFLAELRSISRLRNNLKYFLPDFVGISLRNIDNVDSFTSDKAWYLSEAKALVRIVRETTDAPIILGGPSFSIMPQAILEYLKADYGIVGEGERAFGNLIALLNKANQSPKIVCSDQNLLTGHEIGSGLYSEKLVTFYLQNSGMVNLQTKRGCPHRCLYCTYPSLEGHHFRYRDSKEVAQDIIRLKRQFDVTTIAFADSVFNDSANHYLTVAEKILSKGIKIKWSGFFRPQGIGRKELHLLKRSGLYAVELGTDAASDTTLEGLYKGFLFQDVLSVNDACVKEEIPCAHFIMFGGPGETSKTLKEGLCNIERLEKCVVFAFSGIRLLPKTDLYCQALKEGMISEKTSLLKPLYYFSHQVSPERMNRSIEASFQKRRDRIFPPHEGQLRLEAMKRFGFRGLLWDRLIRY